MNQTSIKSLFAKKSKEHASEASTVPVRDSNHNKHNKHNKKTVLTSTDEQIMKYYETLSANQRVAHEIAVEKLGTSYDVTRTHGYLAWLLSSSKWLVQAHIALVAAAKVLNPRTQVKIGVQNMGGI